MQSSSASPTYLPHIDGLRALSVLLVLVHHCYHPKFTLGGWGVTLFFIISGYLITGGIQQLRTLGLPARTAFRVFMVKRAARLYPVYLLSIAFACLSVPEVRHTVLYYLTYTTNLLIWQTGDAAGYPTWTLAIEEQFYLVWFFVAFLLSTRGAVLVAVFCLLSAPVFRAFNESGQHVLLWLQADALAAGALLQLLRRQVPQRMPPPAVGWALMLFVFVMGVLLSGKQPLLTLQPDVAKGFSMLKQSLFIFGGAVVVWHAAHQPEGWMGRALAWAPLVYLGKISYGVYIFDMSTSTSFNFGMALITDNVPFVWRFGGGPGFYVLTHSALVIGLAALSYRYFENPIRQAVNQRWGQPRGGGVSHADPRRQAALPPV